MPQRTQQIIAVYGSGVLVGVALILFPSAGTLFTDPAYHNLSSAQFGVLFTPQVVTAIAASVLTAALARRQGMKRTLQLGLALAALAMLLLAATQPVIGNKMAAFGVLLLATAAIGAGLGFTISALNAYAFDLFPGREDSAVTAIHVATGSGQVGAALILSFFVARGSWWGAPLTIALVIGALLLFQARLPLRLRVEGIATPAPAAGTQRNRLPARVWLFAVITFAYGALEGTFGNWTPIYLAQSAGLTLANAALGLSLFWGAVTAGRVLFALAATRVNVRPLFYVTPAVVGVLLLLWPAVGGTAANLAVVIAAGLALSYFFPYAVSRASAEFPLLTVAVSGLLVAGLQFGNGLSATVVGAASQALPLGLIMQLSAAFALLMGAVVIYLGARSPAAHRPQTLPTGVLPGVQPEEKQQ